MAGRDRVRRRAHGLAVERLDLDHLGTEVGQHLRAEGPGDEGGEVENAQPAEETAAPRPPGRLGARVVSDVGDEW